MFQKQTFGSTNTGFGSLNTSTTSPFGGFKLNTGTSAFGAPPAFGANATPQPAATGGLFGSPNTSGGLFGSNPTTSTFGQSSGFGFGASTSSGLFNNSSGGGLFGNNQNNSAFGAKPAAGFGFGNTTNTATTGGLFGAAPSTSTGLFGQQNNTITSGGLFGGTSGGFGQTQSTGTAHVKYNPVVGTDVVVKSGTSQNVNIKHHCISCMKEYEGKSLEELRLEDYAAGRKGAAAGAVFGFQQTESKPLFGGSSFGQPATTSAPSLFGSNIGTTPAFGQTNTFSFGSNTQTNTNTTGLFGANKPAFGTTATTGTGLFGATTTQAPSFGSTNTFGFGANTQNQATGGLFGAKPATSAFGATPASTGFGGFGGGLFGKPQQTTAPTFGSTAPTFGSTPGFGTNTTGSNMFGGGTFAKPATTQPSFGFNAQPTLGAGLGTGLGTSFQAKPAAPAFGALGTGSIFNQPAQNNTFRTGLDSGLGGGGLFGNTSALGGTSLGLGQLNANNTSLTGGAAGAGVHEQILTLAARPYGDTPLFKDLVPDGASTAEDILKPTNPTAVKAVLDNSAYRVSSPPASKLTLRPRPLAPAPAHKKSLFDGLEEYDASLDCKLSLKPSRKRLVLRPRSDGTADTPDGNRSLEDSRQEPSNTREEGSTDRNDTGNREEIRHLAETDVNHADSNTDNHNNWPNSTQSWPEKEKSIDGEGTPRIYPNLDKELPAQVSERRASWLTTKPLRKPLDLNPDSVENSVRELGVRTHRVSEDKENINTLSVSEEENVQPRDVTPHPAGLKLTRPGYYTIPSLEEITKYLRPDGTCVVPHLTVGRNNYGNVFYDCEIDVAGLDLDSLVHFLNKEVIIYPEDDNKPPVGAGLNRRAVVTLERVWPRDKTEKRPVTEPDRLLKMDYEGKLRRICDKYDTKFIEYRPQTGSWVFRVEHFSKYGLSDSDEEDDTPDVLKRQIVNQSLQKAAPIQKPQPVLTTSPLNNLNMPTVNGNSSLLGGLGGLGVVGVVGVVGGVGGLGGVGLGGLGGTGGLEMFNMQQTSLNLLSGSKVFDMDTTDDNAEAPSLYQDNRAYGVRSPTSELARLEHRQSDRVQVMKASLYADTEMQDDISISTGDQLVPSTITGLEPIIPDPLPTVHRDMEIVAVENLRKDEVKMAPLYIQPHTVVLQFHRKVPPFKHTVAGRLNASSMADLSISRARHFHTGFGVNGTLATVSTMECLRDLPKNANLPDLHKYIEGRHDDDWSESVVTRLSIGRTGTCTQNMLTRHLQTLLKHSDRVPATVARACDKLVVRQSQRDRRDLLRQLVEDAGVAVGESTFGVSAEYWLQVWKLCDALWAADLENDGIPGTDELSIVNRHKRLLEWFKYAVNDITDKKLAEPRQGEKEDENDFHSARVLTLLLGGRILEACKLCRDNGDLNMAALIAQCAGDPAFKSLITRQLNTWRECGAVTLLAENRISALNLLSSSGRTPDAHWLHALHAVARYITPQIPTLEQIIRTYESNFNSEDEVDLTTLPDDEMLQFPVPPYLEGYCVSVNGKTRRILDLRYELLRARAFNTRPRLSVASYTPDPFDYSLSFLISAWLSTPSIESIIGTSEQLQARGDWHLAVQVLMYHPQDDSRSHLIRNVLSRYAPAEINTQDMKHRMDLIQRLGVPVQWVLMAQAHRAKYEHKPSLEVQYLVGAEQWNEAHKVLLEELLPETVLSDNVHSIKDILEKLNAAALNHEVSDWESGGQALYHYMHICDEMRGAISANATNSLSERLEALRPSLSAACRALTQGLALATTKGTALSAKHSAARAEMGARLLQLALAGGEPTPHIAGLLKKLKLPPDCAARARDKITVDIAEQASELCRDAPGSPHTHQRATVKS